MIYARKSQAETEDGATHVSEEDGSFWGVIVGMHVFSPEKWHKFDDEEAMLKEWKLKPIEHPAPEADK